MSNEVDNTIEKKTIELIVRAKTVETGFIKGNRDTVDTVRHRYDNGLTIEQSGHALTVLFNNHQVHIFSDYGKPYEQMTPKKRIIDAMEDFDKRTKNAVMMSFLMA